MRRDIRFVLGIAAGKGGVGKSSVTVQLAFALQRQGFSVGILDADVYGPSLRKMLPEERLPTHNPENPNYLLPALCSGIKVISTAYFRGENEAAIVRAPIANGVIQQFLGQVEWGELDYLLIDFPPGTGDIQLTLLQEGALSAALLVTTPQEVALLDVRKAMQMFKKLEVPVLGVVENMSYFLDAADQRHFLFGKEGGLRLAEEQEVPFLGEIPIDPRVSSCGDSGRALSEGPAFLAFKRIAHQVEERLADLKTEGVQILDFMQKDPSSLTIAWSDGRKSEWQLRDLQRVCPCARCRDQLVVQEDVAASAIKRVGSYALKITFNSGCSKGIYPFSLLRRLSI